MRKGIKIVLVVVIGFIGILFLAALLSGPYVNHDVEAINGIDNFVVLEQGSQYIARFSLVDTDFAPAASDVNVHFSVAGWEQNFNVTQAEFGQYQLQLTGQQFTAYAWTLPDEIKAALHEGESYDSDTAYITVTLPDGRQFDAEETVF